MKEDTRNGIVLVFIDGDNIHIGLRKLKQGLRFDELKLIIEKRYRGSFINFNFYVPRTDPDRANYQDRTWILDHLNKLGFRVVECVDGQKQNSGNDQERQEREVVDDYIFQDILIGVAESLPYTIKVESKTGEELPINIVLFSGDGDFYFPLLLAKKMGAYITVIAFESVISEQLKGIADEYIDLREDKEFSQAVFSRENQS